MCDRKLHSGEAASKAAEAGRFKKRNHLSEGIKDAGLAAVRSYAGSFSYMT